MQTDSTTPDSPSLLPSSPADPVDQTSPPPHHHSAPATPAPRTSRPTPSSPPHTGNTDTAPHYPSPESTPADPLSHPSHPNSSTRPRDAGYRPLRLVDALWQRFAEELAGFITCSKCPAPKCGPSSATREAATASSAATPAGYRHGGRVRSSGRPRSPEREVGQEAVEDCLGPFQAIAWADKGY